MRADRGRPALLVGSDPERGPLRRRDQLRRRLRGRLEVLLHDAHRRDDAVADHGAAEQPLLLARPRHRRRRQLRRLELLVEPDHARGVLPEDLRHARSRRLQPGHPAPAHGRQPVRSGRRRHRLRPGHGRVPDAGSDRDVGSGARRVRLRGRRPPVHRRRLHRGGQRRVVGRHRRHQRLDAARAEPDDEPWPNHGRTLAHDGAQHLVPGHLYCVRVRAYTDKGYDQNHILHDVVGDWAYLDNGMDPNGEDAVSFEFSGYPDDTSCTDVQPDVHLLGRVPAGRRLPAAAGGVDAGPHAVLHVEPDAAGAGLLRAGVARPELHDGRRLRLGARAGLRAAVRRQRHELRGRDDRLLLGRAAVAVPERRQRPGRTRCWRTRPTSTRRRRRRCRSRRRRGNAVNLRPTFAWGLADWARTYTLQVATDPLFSDIVETVETTSSSYTPENSYPADQSLYWRVRSNDWNDIAPDVVAEPASSSWRARRRCRRRRTRGLGARSRRGSGRSSRAPSPTTSSSRPRTAPRRCSRASARPR